MIKRSTIVINKPFQYRYAGVAIASIFVSIAVIWFCLWRFERGAQDLLQTTEGLAVTLAAVVTFVKYASLRLGIMAVLVSIFSLYVSHKVAGPMYRFQKTLESVTTGDLTIRAFLRDGDELNDVKDALNQALISIHSRVRQDKEKAGKAAKALEDVRTALSQGGGTDVQALAQKFQALEKELHEIGSRFKV